MSAQPQEIFLKDYTPAPYAIIETHLNFDLYEDHTLVTSRLRIERQHTGDLVLNGQHLKLKGVAVDQTILPAESYQVDEEFLTLANLPDQCELTIITEIEPQNNTALEGLYKSGGMFCTQCEAEGFRRITYYLDRPDVMSVFTTRVTADQSKYPILLSNGNAIAEEPLEDGRHAVVWHDPHKKPCYLFALVAGDLKVKESTFTTMSGREVALKIFVEPQNIDKTDYAMGALKRSMTWDEEVYGREYDLDIFMIVAVDDFNMGAMENKGLNIFNSSCVLANPQTATDAAYQRIEAIVAHEYFHNWSGNRVTCRDWFQLSLKEGFTVFRDACFTADMHSETVKRIEDATLMRTIQYAEDAGPLAHQVQPDSFIEISNFYTVTIYEKGAEIVSMIHKLLGKEGFRKGSDLYFDRHDGQAVTINEFVSAMEDANSADLTQFKRWYKQAGTPSVAVSSQYDVDKKQFVLTFKQSMPSTPKQTSEEKLPLHIPVEFALLDAKGNEIEQGMLELTEAEQSFVFDNVEQQPVPSLFRDYTAPVKWQYDYSPEQLAFLMANDKDGFNRWDAAQQLAVIVIERVMSGEDATHAVAETGLLDAYKALFSAQLDDAMLAKMLLLPNEAYIAELQSPVDVQAIYKAREAVKSILVAELEEDLLAVYQARTGMEEYQPESDAMAKRSLKNTALSYLAQSQNPERIKLAEEQFAAANNMTDGMAALSAMVNSQYQQQAKEALDSFYQQWKDEPLVVNQWLSVQSASNQTASIEHIRELLEHPAFDIKNPNKVRSVLGAFAGSATQHFHKPDGSGYELLAEYVAKLDKLNPQIASRLVAPLTKWQRYTPELGEKMIQQLRKLEAENELSKDVFEVVTKALVDCN